MKSAVMWDRCFVCDAPIFVGDKCFEVGFKPRDKRLLCTKCYGSIKPYDTEEAYDEYENA